MHEPRPEPRGDAPADVTRFLVDLKAGRAASGDALLPWLHGELHGLAEACFRSQSARHTLQPTALVHEVYLKLFAGGALQIEGRRQFFALAARAMRQLLVDHARGKDRQKRGGGAAPETFHDAIAEAAQIDVDVLDLDAALAELERVDPRQAELVHLRFFAGLDVNEAAELLQISPSTAERSWRAARAWLALRLSAS